MEIPRRRALGNYHYLIDPYGDLLPVLKGAGSLAELFGAWDILRVRISRGNRFVLKYMGEIQGEDPASSPATTAANVHESFEENVTPAQRIREYKTLVESHMPKDDPARFQSLLDLNTPLEDVIDVPEPVKTAFPAVTPSDVPQVFSYNEKGEREDLSFLRRSSINPVFAANIRDAPPTESISSAFTRKNRTRGREKRPSCTLTLAPSRRRPKSPRRTPLLQ